MEFGDLHYFNILWLLTAIAGRRERIAMREIPVETHSVNSSGCANAGSTALPSWKPRIAIATPRFYWSLVAHLYASVGGCTFAGKDEVDVDSGSAEETSETHMPDVVLPGFNEDLGNFIGLEYIEKVEHPYIEHFDLITRTSARKVIGDKLVGDSPTGRLTLVGNNVDGTLRMAVGFDVGPDEVPSTGRASTHSVPVAEEATADVSGLVRVTLGHDLECCVCSDVGGGVRTSSYVGESGTLTIHIQTDNSAYFDLSGVRFVEESTGEEVLVESYESPDIAFRTCQSEFE